MRPSLKHFPRDERHIEDVYAYYEKLPMRPRINVAAYWLMGKVLKPHVSQADPQRTSEHLKSGGVILLAGNHLSAFDPFVLAGAIGTQKNWRPIGRNGRAIAKISLYRGNYRPVAGLISRLGGIPAARDKDDSTALGTLSRERLVALNTRLVARGQHHLVYPQGTRVKEGDPFTLAGDPKTGVGRIAVTAAQAIMSGNDSEAPSSVGVLPLAIHYPNGSRNALIHSEPLIPVTGTENPRTLTFEIVAGIQSALDVLATGKQHAG